MTETCAFIGDRDETLIAYLYDDIDAIARARFDAHLATCVVCRDELRALGGVRQQLARWAPPEPAFAAGRQTAVVDAASGSERGRESWWRDLPAWAEVAAALLFLGVAAGLANLNVHYDQTGLTVRTGWSSTQAPVRAPASEPRTAAVAPARADAVSRADLVALEQRLRGELRAASASARSASSGDAQLAHASNDADVIRRVRTMIDDTEKRQQRELALRIGEVLQDVNAQRQADLVRIDRNLGLVQNNLGVEVLKQRQSLNYLMRVNQVQK